MSLVTLLHDPTWLKVRASAAVAGCGVLGLIALRMLAGQANKRNIYKPSVLIAETYGPADDYDSAEIASTAPVEAPKSPASPGTRRLIILILAVACITVSITASAYGLRNYTILTNWQDGERCAFIGDYVGAIICYNKALKADPSLRHTHLLIGVALLQSGKTQNAIPELRAAATGENSDTEPVTSLGDALMVLKRPAEAAEAYRRGIAISPRDETFYIALACALQATGKVRDAYTAFEKAIEIAPRNIKAHVKLGELLVSNGHLDEGFAHLRRAVILAPNDLLAHNSLATAYARIGLYDAAIAEYKESIDLNPGQPLPLYDLGAALERKKDFPKALDAFKRCTTIAPHSREDVEAQARSKTEIERMER